MRNPQYITQDLTQELCKTQLKLETFHRVRWRIGCNYVDPTEEYAAKIYQRLCFDALRDEAHAANDPAYGEDITGA